MGTQASKKSRKTVARSGRIRAGRKVARPRTTAKRCSVVMLKGIFSPDGSVDVERLAEEAMTGSEFKAFLRRRGLTYEAAAALLGRSRRQIGYYVAGSSKLIPRLVALACFGLSAREAAA